VAGDAIRNYLVFDADFQHEHCFAENIQDNRIPAGRELAEFILSLVQARAKKISAIWNEEDYAWSFNCKWNGVTINVLVGRSDQWLIIFSIVSLLPRFFQSQKYQAALGDICSLVDRGIRADSRIHEPRWFTRSEFDQLK